MNDNQTKEKKTIDDEFITQLRTVVSDFLSNDDFQEAYKFIRIFDGPLGGGVLEGPVEYLREMKIAIIQAKWVALPLLKEDEILELFRSYFLAQYDLPGLEYDLWNKVRTYLISLKVFQDRDEMRKKIREALLNNREIITSRGLSSNDGLTSGGTINNWLNGYNKEMGAGPVNTLQINSYLNRHAIENKLAAEEVERLRKLFNFFEIMKISSLEPEGYEENFTFYDEKLGPGIVRAGRFEPIDPAGVEEMKKFIQKMKELKIPPFDKIEENTTGGQTSGKTIGQEKPGDLFLDKKLERFLSSQMVKEIFNTKSSFGDVDLKILRNNFYQAVNVGKAEEAVAALLLIAESGGLREAFAGDERFVKFWGDYLAKNNPAVAGEFVKDPANAKDLAGFLQYILEGRLKMKGEEAAMIGVLIANSARLAGELNYKTLAYGDMETGEFRWNI